MAQMFVHALDHLKGWPSPSAVDSVAKLSSNVTVSPVYGGRVVHKNASGEFELGAAGWQMPIFLIQSSSDFDVANPGNGTVDPYGWNAIAPVGYMSGLVATGAYELESTEVVTGLTYAINDPLHAPTEAQCTTAANAGLLYNNRSFGAAGNQALQPGIDNVCAVVSQPKHLNHHRVNVVSFWPVYSAGTQ
jgi:hypothetical protein